MILKYRKDAARCFAALLSCLFLLTAFCGCHKEENVGSTGKGLSLRIAATAEQDENEGFAVVTVELLLDFDQIDVGYRTMSTLTVNGSTVNFTTQDIASDTPGTERLYSGKFNVKRTPGTSVQCPIRADWNFRGTADGESLLWLTAQASVTLDDTTVKKSGGGTETGAAQTEPVGTEPAETEPAETEPEETGPVETEPVETAAPETDPPAPETVPPETDKPDVEVIDPNAFTTWKIRSDTGTYLNLIAKCSASEVKGGYRITVNLYLEHSSIFVGSRTGGSIRAAGQTFPYTAPTIERAENDTTETFLGSAEFTVKRGEAFTVSANYPFNGVYGGTPLPEVVLEGKYVFE